MFRPAALFIGLRYTRAKRRNHFISFISVVSMVGIALGVATLITVLSVMNGFDREIQKRVFSMVPPMTISSVSGTVSGWESLEKSLMQFQHVKATAPFVAGEVLLNFSNTVQPALINGILPEQQKNVIEVGEKMVKGKLSDLKAGRFGIVIGENLAQVLNINVGEKITVVTPQVTMSPAGMLPRYKQFTVVGIFRAGGGFGFDRGLAFMHFTDAQKLMGIGQNATGIYINLDNVYAAPRLAEDFLLQLTPSATITTWADQFGEFFHAVKLEKTMMFLILILIIAVAAFNLVSTLMMVVSEKESDIAILRTFGATPNMIMGIFIVQGALVGIMGTLFGVLFGVLLAWNATSIVNWLEAVFHTQFLSSNVYFVNYLPSQIQMGDIVTIAAASLFLSLIATIYPAWRASKTDPVESLRYE